MSATETNWPATTAEPLLISVPAPGKPAIRTLSSAFTALSAGSVKPKSAAVKT